MDSSPTNFHFRKLPHDLMLGIASRERTLRKQKKLSQAELADRSGVSLGSLKRFEKTGKISLESLLKLAYTLNSTAAFEEIFPVEDIPETLDDLFK